MVVRPLLAVLLDPGSWEEAEAVILAGVSPATLGHQLRALYGLDTAASATPVQIPIKVKIEEAAAEEEPVYAEYDAVECKDDDEDFVQETNYLKNELENDVSTIKVSSSKLKKVIKCVIDECDRTFWRTDKYKKHFLKAHEDQEYVPPSKLRPSTCRTCGKEFATYKLLKAHNKKAHHSDDYHALITCEFCGEVLKGKNSLSRHMRQLHSMFRCSCSVEFKTEFEFYEHKQERQEEGCERECAPPEACPCHTLTIQLGDSVSGNQTRTKVKIRADGVKKKGCETWYPCTHCHETFAYQKDVKKHMLEAHWSELKEKGMLYTTNGTVTIKNVACEYENCDKYFRDKDAKDTHVAREHTKERTTYICEICSKTFLSKSGLREHKNVKHSTVVDPQMCNECGDVFDNKSKLTYHITIVHKVKERKFHCRFCDYRTYAKPQLVEHERTHTGEKPEICSHCGQGFSSKKARVNHERLHTGEKPYKCSYCDNSFVQRTSLNVHIQTHHKEVHALADPKVVFVWEYS